MSETNESSPCTPFYWVVNLRATKAVASGSASVHVLQWRECRTIVRHTSKMQKDEGSTKDEYANSLVYRRKKKTNI